MTAEKPTPIPSGPRYRNIGGAQSVTELRQRIAELGLDLEVADDDAAPAREFARPSRLTDGFEIGNRFCIHPMEGWDATTDGKPTDLTRRRWQRFGQSGAKLIWGGEAVAVSPEGRANPNQLMMNADTVGDIADLRRVLVAEHEAHFGTSQDLLVGLQLTHSGRFARPDGPPRPRIVYHHPLLDARFENSGAGLSVLSDAEIDQLCESYVRAAVRARDAGFAFVDIKHCHGYLGHEFLTAMSRSGRYGGSFENRTRFLRTIVAGIRAAAPDLRIGVRVSLLDTLPYTPGEHGIGRPMPSDGPYQNAFGAASSDPLATDDTEPVAFLSLLRSLGIQLVNVSIGSPYYNPHIQRPALFPPSDGYLPPEDPLCGVARHINLTAQLKTKFPDLLLVGSGYSYLQQWLPAVGAAQLARNNVDFVGLGRLALSYPDFPADVLAGRSLQRRYICKTFSDCTTAPRNGLVSGCYPLDQHYRERPEYSELKRIKRGPSVERPTA